VIHKAIWVLATFMLVFMACLLFVKMKPIFLKAPDQKIVAFNEVRGASIEKDKVLYTLNFEAQENLIRLLNQLELEDFFAEFGKQMDFDRIIIYRFDQPDLVLNKEF